MNIKVLGLTKSFGNNHVLQGINLETESGKALGILGRNGAGKTTAIRIIMGVFLPDSGEVLVDNLPIDRNQLGFGYLPEERGLYSKKKILEQLVYFGALKGMSKKAAVKSVEYWLERLQISEYTDRRLDTLSKGNQQKIQLAATLISNPDIIILDEPFSGLDPVNAMLLKDIVKELVTQNKIVLFSSHQMNYIEEFCDNIAILNGGKIVLSGSIKEIKRSYDRSKLQIISPELEKIKKFVKEECYIEEHKLFVKLESSDEKGEFMARLLAQKFDIDELRVHEPTLNDIFVEYTEDKIK